MLKMRETGVGWDGDERGGGGGALTMRLWPAVSGLSRLSSVMSESALAPVAVIGAPPEAPGRVRELNNIESFVGST